MDMITVHKLLFTICSFSLVYKYYIGTPPTVLSISNPEFNTLGPYNTTKIFVDDVYDQLIDVNNFTFKINPQPCKNYPAGFLLMVIVLSSPNNHENRRIIRKTWGRNVDTTKVVFLVGEPENITIYNEVLDESSQYGDIVQGTFVDVYRNLTYKHVMGLKWIYHHCPSAKYILKIDDDVVVNSHELRHFLARELSPWGCSNLIMGNVYEHSPVRRSNRSKWKVTTQEYGQKYYPTYCGGWAVIYSQDVIPRLLKATETMPYFWLEDVYVTGMCAQKIGVARTPINHLMLKEKRANMLKMLGPKYVGPFVIGPAQLSVDEMNEIWKAIPE